MHTNPTAFNLKIRRPGDKIYTSGAAPFGGYPLSALMRSYYYYYYYYHYHLEERLLNIWRTITIKLFIKSDIREVSKVAVSVVFLSK